MTHLTLSDSGDFTCSPSGAANATVTVKVAVKKTISFFSSKGTSLTQSSWTLFAVGILTSFKWHCKPSRTRRWRFGDPNPPRAQMFNWVGKLFLLNAEKHRQHFPPKKNGFVEMILPQGINSLPSCWGKIPLTGSRWKRISLLQRQRQHTSGHIDCHQGDTLLKLTCPPKAKALQISCNLC